MPATVPEKSVQDHLRDLSMAHHVTRHWTLPPFAGGSVLLCGVGVHYSWWWVTALVWTAGVVLVITGYDHAARLPGAWERLWGLACVTWLWAAPAWWTVAGWANDWSHGLVLFLQLAAGIPLAIPWSLHRRVRRGVEVSRTIRAFDRDTLTDCGLKGVTMPPATVKATSEDKWEGDLVPDRRGTYTLEKMRRAVPALAAALGVSESKVEVIAKERRRGRPFRARLLVDEGTAAALAVKWAPPAKATDIREEYVKGVLSGGGAMRSSWWVKSYGAVAGIAGGSLGGGKTSSAMTDAARLVTSSNALGPWIYDGKPGSPNWAQWGQHDTDLPALADWYTTTAEGFRAQVRACWAIAETRGKAAKHDPSFADPFVGIICDEAAIVFAPTEVEVDAAFRDRAQADRVAEQVIRATREYLQIQRSTGTALRMSTVRPEQKSVGDTTIRSFLQGGECAGFITSNPRDSQFLFSGRGDIPIHLIPQDEPGTCYVKNFAHPVPVRGRVVHFDDDPVVAGEHDDNSIQALRRWKRDHPESVPTLPQAALEAIRAKVGSAYDDRWAGNEPAAIEAATTPWPRCECTAELGTGDEAIGACLACGRGLTGDEVSTLAALVAGLGQDPEAPERRVDLTKHEPTPPFPEAPRRYASPDAARRHCLDALAHLGEGWHKASEVRALLGEHKSQDIVTGRLTELEGRGLVTRRGRRERTEWRLIDRPEQQQADPGYDPNSRPEQGEQP